jgi:hypothetical protein
MMAHVRDAVTPPSQIRTEIPADLESIVLRCLAKSPNDRYQDTLSLAQALDRCVVAVNWSPQHAASWWEAHASESRKSPPPTEPVERHRPPTPASMFALDSVDARAADRIM